MSMLGIPTTGFPVLKAKALTVAKPTRKLVKDPGPKATANPSIWENFIPAESRILSTAGKIESSSTEAVFKFR
jgi:hypothetical protein